VVARAIVATKAEREAFEEQLESLKPWRRRRRAEIERRLAQIRNREETLLAELGGTPEPH
jgi:hypothetical protein